MFELLDRRQAGFQLIRHGLAKVHLADAHGLVEIAQGVFGHDAVALLAEHQADRRIVFRRLDLLIEGSEVEIQLAGIFRLEPTVFQFDRYIAMQLQMIE